MRKAGKQFAFTIVQSLCEILKATETALENKKTELVLDSFVECQQAAICLGNAVEASEGEDFPTVKLIESYCEKLYAVYEAVDQGQSTAEERKELESILFQIKNSIEQDIPTRLEVVFLPYKASMWDSLESVWMAAEEDTNCDAYVIPIPYYDKNPDGSFREMHYEGADYPDYVPVTDYREYDFGERRPDMIFIHNPYDEYNYVTSVEPFFYSKNLKKYTDKLVYIPYFILDEILPDDRIAVRDMRHFCETPGVLNADQVVVQSENMRQVYINVLIEFTGTGESSRKDWEKKILGLGSPKVDKVLNTRREDLVIPEEWLKVIEKPDGSWKKIVLYNTSVTGLLENNEQMIKKIQSVFESFYKSKEETALLWRPHPLIESTLLSMRPELWEEYRRLKNQYIKDGWGIYDDSADLERVIAVSNVYYGDKSSVVRLCQSVGKPVMIQEL